MDEQHDEPDQQAGEAAPDPQQQALDAIRAMSQGANPAQQAIPLSNAFTDRQWARLTGWFRRR